MARAHFNDILLVRQWCAGYGGVYVKKDPGVESNPFLEKPDIETRDGVVLTLKNPALVTREISELSDLEQGYSFHMTSLRPINPANAPDEFEASALRAFEAGKREAYEITDQDGGRFYMYIAPLHVEKSCLQCHSSQGYKVGDIIGGIRVKFNIQQFSEIRQRTVFQVILLAMLLACGLIVCLFLLMRKFETRLVNARNRIKDMAMLDPLTGVCNRGCLMFRLEQELDRGRRKGGFLGCLMLDIDHFKKINDIHGHLFGDEVLKELCVRIAAVVRPYDILARYGGEEFVVLLPEADIVVCRQVGLRILQAVRAAPFKHDDISVKVTVSIGVSCVDGNDSQGPAALLKRTDKALYIAKEAGRDRLVKERTDAGT